MAHAPTTKPMAVHIGKKRVVATFVDLFIVRPKPTVPHEGDVNRIVYNDQPPASNCAVLHRVPDYSLWV